MLHHDLLNVYVTQNAKNRTNITVYNHKTNMSYIEQKITLDTLKTTISGKYPRVAKVIKEKTGKEYSIPTISRVLNGEWVNNDIIRAAKKVYKEVLRDKADAKKELEKILAS